MDGFKVLLSNAGMEKTATNQKATAIGKAIRSARKQRTLVIKDVAEHLKVSVAAVGNWEKGNNLPSTENLLKVAEYLRVDAAALGRGEVAFLGGGASQKLNEVEVVSEPEPLRLGPMDVRVLGGAVGGDDGDFWLNGSVAGYARRPPGLAHMPDVFAIHILTDSMVPRYDPGELLYCGGRAPMPGDHVLIEMYPEEGETTGKAYVKKLVRRTKAEIICEQYNPKGERIFDAYSLKNMWRIIPSRELFGF